MASDLFIIMIKRIVQKIKKKSGKTPFWENLFYFIERGIFASNCKFSNKNDLLCAWRDFNKTFCGISTYHKWMFKLQISSIFNFDQAHQSWISGLLGVKRLWLKKYFFRNKTFLFFKMESWNFQHLSEKPHKPHKISTNSENG